MRKALSGGLICVRWSTSSTEQTAIAVIWLRVSSEADYEYPIDDGFLLVTGTE